MQYAYVCAHTYIPLYTYVCTKVPTDRSSAYLSDYQISIHLYMYICVCVSNAHYIYKVYTRVRVYPFVCDQHTFSPDGKAHKIDNKLKARTGHIERGAQTVQSQEDISWRLQRRPLWFLVLSETMHGQFWILSIAFGCLAYIYKL